ncbi:MAG: oligogalacturonate lyase family protein [Bryobacterales bacterium]|nr:oligogalacturonate lyase family protein [Bryobacterales bacterium]
MGKVKWRKGARGGPEHSCFEDAVTGATVHQLTTHPSISHPTYFLQCSFTEDQRHLLFTGYRGGNAQLFEAEFPEGRIRQLTGGEPVHPFSAVIAPGGAVLFVRGGAIWRIDRETLEEHPVAESGGQLGECSLSPSGDWFVSACKREGGWGLLVGTIDGHGSHFIEFPRTIIHPQFNPVHPEWIEFAADPAPRMHRVRRDGSGLECLHEHSNDEFIVHETFLGASEDLVFCVWPTHLKRLDWRTGKISTISEFNAWHIAPSRDGKRILCDTVHPDRGLQLVDVESGKRSTVCASRASSGGSQWRRSRYAVAEDWKRARRAAERDRSLSWMEMAADTVYGPQWTHPHPSFSRDETMAVFASDMTGCTQVYVAEIPASPAVG